MEATVTATACEHVATSISDGIAHIKLQRPDKKNALTQPMYQAIADMLHEAEHSDAIRAVLISGVPGVFTAGNDLHDFLHNPPNDERAAVQQVILALARATVPLVAAVDGLAVGIGTTMLLHCDFVYASPAARFVLPFTNLGLVPEAGSSMLLPRLVGHRRAAELLMLGEPFDGETAVELGIANALIPSDQVLDKAWSTAQSLAAKPRSALRQTKILLRKDEEPLEQRIADERSRFGELLQSAASKEIFAAFLEKRQPDTSQFD